MDRKNEREEREVGTATKQQQQSNQRPCRQPRSATTHRRQIYPKRQDDKTLRRDSELTALRRCGEQMRPPGEPTRSGESGVHRQQQGTD